MLKKILFLLACCIISNNLFAQKIYDTRQICNNEEDITKLVAAIENKSKYLYVLHLKPNACPRCEPVVTDVYNLLPDNLNKVIILSTKTRRTGQEFISANENFKNKHVGFDTGGRLFRIVDHSQTNLNIPYLYKIDCINKTICQILPLLGLKDPVSAVRAIMTDSLPVDCVNVATATGLDGLKSNTFWETRRKIQAPDVAIDGFTQFRMFDTTFYFMEYSTDQLLKFGPSGIIFQLVKKDTAELYHNANSGNRGLYKQMEKDGVIKNIYVDALYSPSRKLDIISASLPELSLDIQGEDSTINYTNSVFFLFKRPGAANENVSYYMPDVITTTKNLTHDHSNLHELDEKFVIGTRRGFPVVGTDEADLDKLPNYNPFQDSFYDFAPQFEIIDSAGVHGYIGSLPSLYKRLHTGYCFLDEHFTYSGNYIATTNSYSGDILIYDKRKLTAGLNKPLYSFTVLPERALMKVHNMAAYPTKLDYILSYTEEFNTMYVKDTRIINDHLFIALKKKSEVIVQKRTLQGKLIKEYKFTAASPKNIEGLLLSYENKRIHIWGLEKTGGAYFICHMAVND